MGDLWGGDGDSSRLISTTPTETTWQSPAVEIVTPPGALLWSSVASVCCAALLFFFPGTTKHVIGYITASFVAIALIGLFWRGDQRARNSHVYSPRPRYDTVSRAVLLGAVVVSTAHVWFLASDLAR